MTVAPTPRALLVMADGVQSAFAAGAVAALSEAGSTWTRGFGAGLGAQVALLTLAGEAAEAERRWLRQAKSGCPLFRPRLARIRERLGSGEGLLLLPDPWRTDGWLDPAELREHLAPEWGGFLGLLHARGLPLSIGILDLTSGLRRWLEAGPDPAVPVSDLLAASACFAGGWGPVIGSDGRVLWGGAAALAAVLPTLDGESCDLVCGFPVPPVGRGRRTGMVELVQARDEFTAGGDVEAWMNRREGSSGSVRLIAPSDGSYVAWSRRPRADLALEWPLPAEHNAELTALAIDYGRFVGKEAAAASEGRS